MAGSRYEKLFSERYHGAANHKAVLYHAAYASVAALGMQWECGPDYVVGEGVEDVELHGVRSGHIYIQLKNQAEPMTLYQIGKVLESFADDLLADPEARFILVSAGGFIEEIKRYIEIAPSTATPPAKLREKAKVCCRKKVDPKLLLARTKFEHKTQEQIESELEQAITARFLVDNGTQGLYASALLVFMAEQAASRSRVFVAQIERLRATVLEVLAQGPASIAVQARLIEEIAFSPDLGVEDYFDGRSARAAHIAAGLDVLRVVEQASIKDALKVAQVCVIVASSGQGKSSLAYRYLYDVAGASGTFLVRGCETEQQAGSIAVSLESRLRLGLDIIVLVDNLSSRTRHWSALVERFSGRNVKFLVTAREEDWKRYGQTTSAFVWRVVRPTLTLDNARSIYSDLDQRGLIHATVRSAEQAFERVHASGLMIEYVYLLTHGHLLEERLCEQLGMLQQEDAGKLQVLRLVSTADRYGCRLKIADLQREALFTGDATLGINSLSGEYVMIDGDEIYGLHPVRSTHVSTLLNPFGAGEAVAQICRFLQAGDLPDFIASALSDPDVDPTPALEQLVARCVRGESDLIAPIWDACYRAAEQLYVNENLGVIEDAADLLGSAGVMLLCYLGTPHSAMLADSLSEVVGETGVADLTALVERLRPRAVQLRLDNRLLRGIIESPQSETALRIPERGIATALAALSSGLSLQTISLLIERIEWRAIAWSLPFPTLLDLIVAVQRAKPDEYRDWCQDNRALVEARFKLETRTFAVLDQGEAVVVRFHVDLSLGAPDPNEQAVSRLNALAIMLPVYDYYQTDPVYPLGDAAILPHDGAFKRIARLDLPQEVDARTNRAWHDALRRTLAADGWYEWSNRVLLADGACRPILQLILSAMLQKIDGRTISQSERDAAIKGYEVWQSAWRTLPDPPHTTDERRKSLFANAASEWSSSVANCIRQGIEVISGDHEGAGFIRLVRFNALAASRSVSRLHKALQEARRLAGLDSAPLHTLAEESLLMEISLTAEFLDTGQPQASDAKRAVAAWNQSRNERVLDGLRSWVASLPGDEASRVILPMMILPSGPDATEDDSMPFPAVVIGIRMRTFAALDGELVGAMAQAAQALSGFSGYLYIFGVHPQGRMRRGIKAHVAGLAAELAVEEHLRRPKIFPVEIPLVDVAPFDNIPCWLPEEDSLISKLMDPLRKAAMAAAAYQEGLEMLSRNVPDEMALIDLLTAERDALTRDRSQVALGIRKLRAHAPSARAAKQWQVVVEEMEAALNSALEDPSSFFDIMLPLEKAIVDYFDLAYPPGEAAEFSDACAS